MTAALDFLESNSARNVCMAQFFTSLVHTLLWGVSILRLNVLTCEVFKAAVMNNGGLHEIWMSQSKNKSHVNVSKYTMCANRCVICWLLSSVITTGLTGGLASYPTHKKPNNKRY